MIFRKLAGKKKCIMAWSGESNRILRPGEVTNVSVPYRWKECLEELRDATTPWIYWLAAFLAVIVTIKGLL